MPYNKITELPENIKNVLPEHAREIYLAAYNNAWEQFSSDDRRNSESKNEVTAHKVAWSAVKQKYKKVDGQWQMKH
jgi:cation transport regulator